MTLHIYTGIKVESWKRMIYSSQHLSPGLNWKRGEAQKLGDEVSRMLTYFEKMSEVDVEGLEPTTHALQKENRLREDRRHSNEAQPDELLECAPDLEDRFILIPNVL